MRRRKSARVAVKIFNDNECRLSALGCKLTGSGMGPHAFKDMHEFGVADLRVVFLKERTQGRSEVPTCTAPCSFT